MITRIITEGTHDELFLRHILKERAPSDSYRVIAAGGQSAAVSLVRSYLATQPDRVILVVDADTVDSAAVALRRDRISDALSEVATEDRYCVVVAVPEIEEWYFPSPAAASKVLNRAVSAREFEEIRQHPKSSVRQALFGGETHRLSLDEIKRVLNILDYDAIAELPEVKLILEFIQSPCSAVQ